MGVKKRDGKTFLSRGSNKMYPQLDDIDALAERCRHKCPTDVAKDLQVPPNCVIYMIDHWFTDDQRASVYWKRRRKH